MLTIEDCIALCGLTEDEVHAIAEHDNITEVAAAEEGRYLCATEQGQRAIKAIIRDDIAAASARGDRFRELALKVLLRNFVLTHPACEERHRRHLHLPERRLAPFARTKRQEKPGER